MKCSLFILSLDIRNNIFFEFYPYFNIGKICFSLKLMKDKNNSHFVPSFNREIKFNNVFIACFVGFKFNPFVRKGLSS